MLGTEPVDEGTGTGDFARRMLDLYDATKDMPSADADAWQAGYKAGRASAMQSQAPKPLPKVRIPRLDLEHVPQYIAAVSKALERGQLDSKSANSMIYAAQMLVAAFRAMGEAYPDLPTGKKIGFIKAMAESLVPLPPVEKSARAAGCSERK